MYVQLLVKLSSNVECQKGHNISHLTEFSLVRFITKYNFRP